MMMKKTLLLIAFLGLCLWTAAARAEVTVRFDTQGGSGSYINLKLTADENRTVRFKIPSKRPVRPGYQFIGWYCRGLEMEYGLCQPGQTIAFSMTEGELTYTAQWENNRHPDSCPYLMAWTCDYPATADIIQVDFKCIEEATSTYYCVHCWYDMTGYTGFQILDNGTHAVILSVWDQEGMEPKIEYAPYARDKGDFGGEGTGKHIISNYPWQSQKWYTMRVQAKTVGSKTVYEQWIRPEDGAWQKISAISLPRPRCGMNSDVAFLEDFYPFSNRRSAMQLRNASARMAATRRWVKNQRYTISNCNDNSMTQDNVNYDCKAEAASADALYMQIGGGGYEAVITVPKDIRLRQCEITDPEMLE